MLTQLSPIDASFVYMEAPHAPMHIGNVMVFDPTDSPRGVPSEEQTRQFYAERIHLMGLARRRLVRVPFDLDYPYWIEDPDFDLEYHIRHVGLPEPHDWRQLFTLSARILGRPLDLKRPPWEVYLVDGLDHLEAVPQGSFALLTKTHHAAVDGTSGMEMTVAISDLMPEGRKVEPPRTPWQGDAVPTALELVARTYGNNLMRPLQMLQALAAQSPSLNSLGTLANPYAGATQAMPAPAPQTRFNRAVSSHRVVGSARLDLNAIKAMRKSVDGATVNDTVLTICGGALRRYLLKKQELPKDPLIAMAPINTRQGGVEYQMGNQVSAMFVGLGTHIADAKQRLQAIREITRTSKEVANAISASQMTQFQQFVPAAVAALAARLTAQAARTNQAQPLFNCTVTNVPGPQVPLYTLGCRAVTTIGYAPIVDGMGLIMPIISYCGELAVSFNSCREMIPDPDFFLECIHASFQDLKTATL